MLVAHVALRFECRIHSYGALSTTIRRQLGWVGGKASTATAAPADPPPRPEEESAFVRLRRKNWARLIAKTYLEDPSLCPSCGKEMRIVAALASPHQDQVIEKIRYSGVSGIPLGFAPERLAGLLLRKARESRSSRG